MDFAISIFFAVVFHGRNAVEAKVLAKTGSCSHHDRTYRWFAHFYGERGSQE
jgi:hypothetical protein